MLAAVEAPRHTGDICVWKDKVYTATHAIKPGGDLADGDGVGLVEVYDGNLKLVKSRRLDFGIDGITYILPSGTGYETYTRAAFERVMEKAKAGATVLVTLGSGAVLSGLREMAGVKTETHYRSQNTAVVKIGGREFSVWEPYRRILTAETAQVVAKDGAGNPMLTVNTLGKGRIVYFNAAIERAAPLDAWPVYAHAAKVAGVVRKVARTNPLLGVTEHPTADGRTIVVAVNYSPDPLTDKITISGTLGTVWRGAVTADLIRLGPNEAAVFEIR